jgi:hypothetical protein
VKAPLKLSATRVAPMQCGTVLHVQLGVRHPSLNHFQTHAHQTGLYYVHEIDEGHSVVESIVIAEITFKFKKKSYKITHKNSSRELYCQSYLHLLETYIFIAHHSLYQFMLKMKIFDKKCIIDYPTANIMNCVLKLLNNGWL